MKTTWDTSREQAAGEWCWGIAQKTTSIRCGVSSQETWPLPLVSCHCRDSGIIAARISLCSRWGQGNQKAMELSDARREQPVHTRALRCSCTSAMQELLDSHQTQEHSSATTHPGLPAHTGVLCLQKATLSDVRFKSEEEASEAVQRECTGVISWILQVAQKAERGNHWYWFPCSLLTDEDWGRWL